MDEWTAFVTARLDEREAVARRNIGDSGLHDSDWSTLPGWPDYQTYSGDDLDAAGDYIDCFRPLRALREIKALREILELAGEQFGYDLPEGVEDGRDPDERECDEVIKGVLEGVVRTFAGIWNDHPDYPGSGQ